MNTTPSEIINAAISSLKEIKPTPKHADFQLTFLPNGQLASFNDIETVTVTVRVPIEEDAKPDMLEKAFFEASEVEEKKARGKAVTRVSRTKEEA